MKTELRSWRTASLIKPAPAARSGVHAHADEQWDAGREALRVDTPGRVDPARIERMIGGRA